RLVDLPALRIDRGLSVRPALVTVSSRATGSLDATQRLGSNTLAFLSIHTDFAETEVDQRRTNVSRFSLFFPEKRWFFLEGTDIFDFGPGISPDVVPFWSRRIGLLDGQTVPIAVGTKESGRVGETRLGLLAGRTGALPALVPATDVDVVAVREKVAAETSFGFNGNVG